MEGVKEKLGRVIRSKWLVIVAGIWIQCTSGSSYTFGLYSQTIKSKLDYDQSTLDTISSCKDIGANVGIISGLLYGASSPWVVLFTGAVQNCVGYAMMWLSVTGKIPHPALWQMCAYMFFAAHAQTFFNTAVVVTSVQNFPTYRGTVVGLMKGFLGLSGAILLQIYHTIYEGDQSSYIFMLSWLPTVVSMLFMFVLRVCPCHQEDGKGTLDWFSAIAMLVAAYLMVAIIVENVLSMDTLSYLIICLVLLIILLFPIVIAVKSELNYSSSMPLYTQPLISQESHIKEIPTHAEIREQRLPEIIAGITEADFHRKQSNPLAPGSLIYSKIPKKEDSESCSNTSNDMSLVKRGKLERGQNFNLFQAMGTLDFWLLFVSMACGMGSGLTTVNNMSQIGSSLGYTLTEITTLVSLWSIWNFLGRFGAGYISETFLHSKGCARPMFIAIALFIMSVGHLVIASGLPGALYAGSVLVGICYGCQWSLMPTTSSEIFGLQHFGTLFNVIATASPIGSYVLSVRVVGYLYDSEAQREKHLKIVHTTGLFQSPEETCNGSHCFRLSFFIMSAVSLLGCFIAMALFIRTRKFYKQVIFERIRFQSCPTVN